MDIPIASQNIHFPGYGMFWVANSISSTLMGWNNRRLQEKAHERNQEFQLELERARNITEDLKVQEEIAFKRRMMAISRQYRQEETAVAFNNQMKAVELQYYLQHSWPLDPQLPYVILKELESGTALLNPRLNVIVLRTPLLPQKKYGGVNDLDAVLYNNMEYSIMQDDIPAIGNIKYRKDACLKVNMGCGNSEIMNIHFLMSQIPTLVIIPNCINDKIKFKSAVWEPQSARPLVRSLFEFDYSPEQALDSNFYREEMIEKIHSSISIIVGAVRDSYMLITQGAHPTLPIWINDNKHQNMKKIASQELGIQRFIESEKRNILESLDGTATPYLQEVFCKEDITNIKRLVSANL